jgi:hypothetical protein
MIRSGGRMLLDVLGVTVRIIIPSDPAGWLNIN